MRQYECGVGTHGLLCAFSIVLLSKCHGISADLAQLNVAPVNFAPFNLERLDSWRCQDGTSQISRTSREVFR